ncbi:MAG: putative toxin-antitoxin system toxin component, PIN family [Betaproteobacteria bacterium]|jgi:putative PIN family toxin of toxin-antitoxin system|nr:putative toxin-antitoxin system toxin component, PIN family [Betaproteobacteria bacterium]MBK7655618.1 putative toxin-antitoxin system toxin component, PIN family [Betaproteobacteria bacterium]
MPNSQKSEVQVLAPYDAVLDTNLVLDLFLFHDPAVESLMAALAEGELRWICTETMQLELIRVLGYPKIAKALSGHKVSANQLLEQASRCWHQVSVPMNIGITARCQDRDDQIFVDLAVAHQAKLFSKDKAVLALAKALMRCNVMVLRQWQ